MREKIKVLFLQMLMIAFGIVTIMSIGGVVGYFNGETDMFRWYHPLSVVVSSVLCSLPYILLFNVEDMPKSKARIRFILHALVLYVIVMGLGYVFNWYAGVSGFITLTVEYFVIYIFVWFAMLEVYKRDAGRINESLDSIRDEE